jgi:conjugal transfer pilus assembly protein TraD
MGETRFEQMLRPVYEARAAVGWAIAGVWLLGIAIVFSAPKLGMIACVLLAIAMTALRLFHASKLLRYKLSLVGKPMAFMSAGRMKTALPAMGANLWLGWGYRWEPMHTQRAYEILKRKHQ